MVTYIKKKTFRKELFMHLDGLALFSTYSLIYNNYSKIITAQKPFNIDDLLDIKKANIGYLNIGLRLLVSQGLLSKNLQYFSTTNKGYKYFSFIDDFTYIDSKLHEITNAASMLFKQHNSKSLFELVDFLVKHKLNPKSKDVDSILYHNLVGAIISPIICSLGMSNSLSNLDKNSTFISITNKITSKEIIQSLKKLFLHIGWIDLNDKFSDRGSFFLNRSTAYGVTTSYLPLFNSLDTLYFGDPKSILDNKVMNNETHVDRKMNVWGSGGAHSLYFKKIDLIIIELFNRPITKQPVGIADMGCGDGTFLIHLYKIIKGQTLRGKHLKTHPLIIIGADFNNEALEVTKKNLEDNKIDNILIVADISHPEKFSLELKRNYNIDLNDMINVRSFLDHNRIYSKPKTNYNNDNIIGAFSQRGHLIKPSDVMQNLVEHFSKWKPYCQKHGILILELHTIDSEKANQNIGDTLASAYDATHGYSDQYILSLEDFLNAAEKAGFKIDSNSSYRFPNIEIPTVSINFFICPSS